MKKKKSIREVESFPIYDITVQDDHCFELENGVIAHNSVYPKDIMSGGTGGMLAATTVFMIGKSQEKDGTDIIGWNFTLNVDKSRYVKEKSKIPFLVTYEGGLNKWAGFLELCLESGHIIKPSNGWYNKVNRETGEVIGLKVLLFCPICQSLIVWLASICLEVGKVKENGQRMAGGREKTYNRLWPTCIKKKE